MNLYITASRLDLSSLGDGQGKCLWRGKNGRFACVQKIGNKVLLIVTGTSTPLVFATKDTEWKPVNQRVYDAWADIIKDELAEQKPKQLSFIKGA